MLQYIKNFVLVRFKKASQVCFLALLFIWSLFLSLWIGDKFWEAGWHYTGGAVMLSFLTVMGAVIIGLLVEWVAEWEKEGRNLP